jgi:hypothetical protein
MLSFLHAAAAAALLASAAGAAAAGANADPSPPLLGPVVTAPFNQTIRVAGFEFDNYVDFFYDATTAPVGSSLSAHHQGQHDELCTSVAGMSLSEEPCTLLDSADSWLYLIFRQSKLCCRACNTTDFCGIIASDWLQENSTYAASQRRSALGRGDDADDCHVGQLCERRLESSQRAWPGRGTWQAARRLGARAGLLIGLPRPRLFIGLPRPRPLPRGPLFRNGSTLHPTFESTASAPAPGTRGMRPPRPRR